MSKLNAPLLVVVGLAGVMGIGPKLANGDGAWDLDTIEDGWGFAWHMAEVVLPDGNPAIAYYDQVNDEIRFAWYSGGDWETAIIATGVVHDCWDNLSMALLPSGQPAISYGTESDWKLRFMYHEGDDFHVGWQSVVVDQTPAAGRSTCLGVFPADHPDPVVRGQPAIASYSEGVQDLKFIWHESGSYSDPNTWQIVNVDSPGMVGWNPSLTFFPADHPDEALRGQPAISYFKWIGVDILRFAWHTGGDMHSDWQTTTVDQDQSYWVGTVSSIAILSSGQPAIAHSCRTHGYLKYACHTGDFDFTSGWLNTIVDHSAGSPAEYARPRMCVLPTGRSREWSFDGSRTDLSGQPVVAYAGSGDLRFAWLDKSDVWHIVTVDSAPWVFGQVGLSIPETGPFEGEPVISYFNGNDLQFAWHEGFGWFNTLVDRQSQAGPRSSTAVQTAGPNAGQPVVFYEMGFPQYGSFLAERDPNGAWHKSRVTDCSGWPTLAFLPSGQPAVAFECSGLNYGERDATGTWQFAHVDNGAAHIALGVSPLGQPAMSYDCYDDLKFAWRDETGTWHVEIVDSDENVGYWTGLAFFPLGHPTLPGQPAISYFKSDPDYDLKFAWRNPNNGWQTTTVDSQGFVGECTSLAIFPMDHPTHAGQPAISYYIYDYGVCDLRFAWHEGDYDLASDWSMLTVDDDPAQGGYTSLVVLPSGQPAISYRDYHYNRLKYTSHVADDLTDPNSWRKVVVDSGGAGWWTSLVVLPNGQPAISYLDNDHWDIKYAEGPAPGDCNCDRAVGFPDIDLFVAAIPNNQQAWAAKYQQYYGSTPPDWCWFNCDVNGNGNVGFDDIDPFVAAIAHAHR